MAKLVPVFDVVVHERIIMKYFDRYGGIDCVLRRSGLRIGHAHDHLRTQAACRRRAGPYGP